MKEKEQNEKAFQRIAFHHPTPGLLRKGQDEGFQFHNTLVPGQSIESRMTQKLSQQFSCGSCYGVIPAKAEILMRDIVLHLEPISSECTSAEIKWI